ncbi:hypothetical protein B0H34DRAFT_807999 [Crassisporium funariophilum]|nr:hypothetical protein B0H34DRAFT_807999 [Crassisporium funariophilum]
MPLAFVLKDSHKRNSLQATISSLAWTPKLKHPVNLHATSSHRAHVKPLNDHPQPVYISPDMTASTTQTTSTISPTYFASPVQTLSESLTNSGQDCITVHDLVEAYNVLSTRIRSQSHIVFSTDKSLPSLAIFSEHSSQISECLSRDIRRVLPSPFDSQHHADAGHSYYSEASFSDEELETAADNVILCHHALRFIGDIFTFQALHTKFTHEQLRALLHDVLFLCTNSDVPPLNLGKISTIVVWILKVQQLPSTTLISEKQKIISTLKEVINLELGGDLGKFDALKAIHCILKQHPILLETFVDLLPIVLDHLNSNSLELRIHAAFALSGFALAKINLASCSNRLHGQISEIVQGYLDVQTSRRKSLDLETFLPAMFKAALAAEDTWRGKGPSFAISVTSCLVVLLEYSLFSSPRSLKLTFAVLTQCAGHKKLCAIQPSMWELLIWAFSRFPRTVDDGHTQDEIAGWEDIRERAFLVVRQELRHGLAINLIISLLNTQDRDKDVEGPGGVDKALSVVAALVDGNDASGRSEGAAILHRFVSAIGAPGLPSHVNREILITVPRVLVDGDLLGRNPGSIVISGGTRAIDEIRPLSETEALGHWDQLSNIWISLARQHLLGSSMELPSELIRIWEALLLVRAQLTQEHQQFTSPSIFAGKVASIVAGFSMPSDQTHAQARYLSFVSQLWATMKTVLAPASLSSPAEIILASLLKKQFALSDDVVKELWSQLCGDLMSVGIPTLLHVLHVRSESQEGTEVTRQLWLVLASNGPLRDVDEDWADLLCFLVMPFGYFSSFWWTSELQLTFFVRIRVWAMCDAENRIWENVFERAITLALTAGQTREVVISHFFQLLGETKLTSLKSAPYIPKVLLQHMTAAEGHKPNSDLMTLVNDVLVASYCIVQEQRDLALEILRLVGRLIAGTATSDIVQLLCTIHTSLSCWIIDADTLLSDDEHNELVTALYCASLDKLLHVEPSIAVLETLAPFICSVFERIRGDGPLAFQSFWRATYHLRPDIPKDGYPLLIKTCLAAWSDFCADSLGDGISLGAESMSVGTLVVPDSQPPRLPSVDEFAELLQPRDSVMDYTLENCARGTVEPVRSRSWQLSPQLRYGTPYKLLLRSQTSPDLSSANQGASFAGSSSALHFSSFAAPPSVMKRPADVDAPPTAKRRKTIAETPPRPRAGKERAHEPDSIPTKSRRTNISTSEPVTRSSSSSNLVTYSYSASQPSSWRAGPGHTSSSSVDALRLAEDDYDYDTWEQGGSAESLREVQEEVENRSDFYVEDSEVGLEVEDGTERMSEPEDDGDILSPSLSDFPPQPRRAQTAPTPSPLSSLQPSYPPPLRRNRTSPSPLPHRKGSSAQLDAVQRAYAVVADVDMGGEEVDLRDIVRARRVVSRIGRVLDELIWERVGEGKDGGGSGSGGSG